MEETENKGQGLEHGHDNDGAQDHTSSSERQEIFSRTVRAGKRTYFFDVKSTRAGEYYLTITESKRRFNNDQGKFFYEKHKLFLYKEDFEKFSNGLEETIEFIHADQGKAEPKREQKAEKDPHTSIEFEDLDAEKTEVTENPDENQESKD